MILGIETSGETAGLALVRDGEVVRERTFPSRMTLNQRLAPQLQELLAQEPSETGLQMIAAGVGPGSFTGVRMGVALAKAFAHALSLPLAGVSAPEAIASALGCEAGSRVLVLQQARGDEVYATALSIADNGLPMESVPTRVLGPEAALEMAHEALQGPPDFIAGDGVTAALDRIAAVFPNATIGDAQNGTPTAVEVARVAALRPESADRGNVFSLTPRYVSLSQAERQFGVDLGISGGGHA